MRIYKTRAEFTRLQAAHSSNTFAGTVCTITDEAANPMYVYQDSMWNSLVTATTNLTGGLEKITAGGTDILIISDQAPNDADGRAVGTIYFQTQG